MPGFEELVVWQVAMATAEAVYRQTRLLPKEELYGLTSQARRAATSVPANIAEGHARSSRKEFVQFLAIAKGSQAESTTLLLLARRIFPGVPLDDVIKSNDQVGKMLTKMRQTLATKTSGP